ncbi:MAG: phosphate ABC transporter substrate-binding protein PstS [Candidatus Omnitrophica bacterium]|nr:phosphate ABC transporter substrate-binding protein PstS [Candidatus Omnitrophota bacterium]
MKRWAFQSIVAAVILSVCASAWAGKILLINGAGATFPYPIYSKWFSEYAKLNNSVNFNYQSIGSGGGIRQITAQTVDFGATDGPMNDEQMQKAPAPILHVPTVLGGVVPIYSLPEVSEKLNFTQAALAGIFLGKISTWNHPEIAKANPGVALPNKPIVVVHRSDGSGTTFVWTDFLSSVSAEWKAKVGKSTSVNWPVGLGGKGNEGVAGLVKQTPYAIGYTELGYATNNKIPYSKVQNRAGEFVDCTAQTISSAAASAKMPKDFRVSIVNAAGQDAYPISSFTWLLVYREQTDRVKGEEIMKFLHWMLKDGQRYSEPLGYAPLPPDVARMVEESLDQIKLP